MHKLPVSSFKNLCVRFWAGCEHVLGFLHRAAFHQACTLCVTWVHKSAHEHLEFIFGLAIGNVFI